MPNFLDLPPELRDMIYEYCLVQGEIIPYPMDYEKQELQRPLPRKPDISLLRVNSVIGAEARVVLYEKNVWRLSYNYEGKALWTSAKDLIRKLNVSFDVRDLDSTDQLEISLCVRNHVGDDTLSDTCHLWLSERLLDEIWFWKVSMMLKVTMLTDLKLDVRNCFCPHGCCRLVKALALGVTDPGGNPSLNPVVEVIGSLDETEVEAIAKIGFRYLQGLGS